jgi:ABC-type sugar transport system permease subunit
MLTVLIPSKHRCSVAIDLTSTEKPTNAWSSRSRIHEAAWGYLLITPNFLIILLFTVIPVFFSLYMSLTDWNILSTPNFIGFENYRNIFSDKLAQTTFLNTFYFTLVSVPITVFLSLLLAVLLDQKSEGSPFFERRSTCLSFPLLWQSA